MNQVASLVEWRSTEILDFSVLRKTLIHAVNQL